VVEEDMMMEAAPRYPVLARSAWALVLCVCVAAFLGVSGLARAASDKPFVIGAVLPKTGAYSQYGDFTEPGLRAGVKQVNELGGILGRKVQIIFRDDASNPGRSVLAAKELVGEQKVDFLYPEIISGLALAVLPYATEEKLVTISNGATPQIGDATKFPYSFQLADLATKRAPAMVAAMKKLGGRKVGILVSTNPPQVALGDQLANDLPKKYGMEVAGHKQFSVDAKDLSPQLQSLRDAGADIVAFDSAARESLRVVMTGMQTLGWKVNVVSEPALLYGDLTQQVPAPVHKQFFAVNYRVGTRSGPPSPALQSFIKDMKEHGPITNLAIGAVARDVVLLVKWAWETAQKEKGNTSADSVKAVLESLGTRTYAANYSLVLGNPRYSAKDHTTSQADYSQFWGLIRVSPAVDGAYEGEPLEIKE
jgi:branched-chain amino acid transport system substrate-binding protein